MYYALKVVLAAFIIVAVTEVAKVNAWLGALIKSLPIISLVAMIWLHYETQDVQQVAEVSRATFWLVLPTLPMFLVFPALIDRGWSFYPALGLAVLMMLICYATLMFGLQHFNIKLDA
jgi:hypothetical protein